MTTTTQQPPSNPALDFANSILEVTNNGLELIEILRDIANDCDEKATTNDRIAAANILTDRAFGKCPKQVSPSPGPAPETGDNDGGTLPETPAAVSQNGPESPRLVTQIDDSLNESLGPPPSAHTPQPVGAGFIPARSSDAPETPDPYSIHFTIQQHILAITNNGQMLRDTLLEIARTEDDPKDCPEPRRRVTPYHRRRAASLLLDRLLGTDPNALHSAVCPDCQQSWTTHTCSPDHAEPAQETPYRRPVRYVDPVALAEARAEIQRMKDEGILTPDPNAPIIDISMYRMPKDFDYTPYAKEEAAKFWADVELRLERQKQWPEIEERRRKKLAQTYPSHSEDDDPPDP